MQNQIDNNPIIKFINNPKIRKYYDLDTVAFVYFLFLIKKIKDSKDIKDLLSKAEKMNNYAVKKVYNHFLYDDFLNLAYSSKDVVIDSYDNLNEIILAIILKYLQVNNFSVNGINELTGMLSPTDFGDVLVISPFLNASLFNHNATIKSVEFYYFSDFLNTLASILFDLLEIPYKEIVPSKVNSMYDTIFYMPPYKYTYLFMEYMRSLKSLGVNNASLEVKEVYRFNRMLKPNGHMFSIVHTGCLSKANDYQYKKVLIEKGKLNSVIELPKIKTYNMPLTLLFFSDNNDKISLTNASKFALNIRKHNEIDSEKILRALSGNIEDALISITKEEAIANKCDIAPHRYFIKKDNDFGGSTKLSNVSLNIFRGYQISSDLMDELLTDDETNIKLLTLSDIQHEEVDKDNLQSLKELDKRMVHYSLKSDDLVITCKGKTIKTAVVDVPYKETYIATGSLIIIRVDKSKIDPYFLKVYLDSKLGRNALKDIQTGTTVLSLNPTKLNDLVIPLPDLETQYTISSSYKYKLKNIKEVREIIEDMEKEMERKFDDNFINLL